MPTFPSPVSVASLQSYLNDTSVDVGVLAFYASLLDSATEKVYTYLDRDYTSGAAKIDIFFGNGRRAHRLQNPAALLISWKYYDLRGAETIADISSLVLLANGSLAVGPEHAFEAGFEHRLHYQMPSSLNCPESVRQVIIEVASILFEESKQGGGRLGILSEADKNGMGTDRVRYTDLTDRQKIMLMPYMRIAV